MTQGVIISFQGSVLANNAISPQVVSAANPLPVMLSGGIGGVAVAGTVADSAAVGAQFPVTIGGVDYASGLAHRMSVDANGNVNVNVVSGTSSVVTQPNAALLNSTVTQGPGNVANPWTVQGPVASAVAASGNPVPMGGTVNTTGAQTTLTAGTRQEALLDTTGSLKARLTVSSLTGTDALTNSSLGFGLSSGNTSTIGVPIATVPYRFNGVSWDREAKPRTAFRLPSSAATNNAANIKTTPGTVFQISFQVLAVLASAYLKFFDGTGVPNPAATTPLYFFPMAFTSGPTGIINIALPAGGLYFPTGIGVAIVANPADLDNTAIAAGMITALQVGFQ